jgi:hypothetical protein
MKTNGFRPSHRNKWMLLQKKILDPISLLLFEYYLDQMDFDSKHKGYGCFEVSFQDITKLFGYSSTNSIRSRHNKLLKLGMISPTSKKHLFKVHNPERYVASTKKWRGFATDFMQEEKDQAPQKIFQYIGANIQLVEQKVQPIEKNKSNNLNKKSLRHLSSFKDKCLE